MAYVSYRGKADVVCQPLDGLFWHETEVVTALRNVRFQGYSGSRFFGPSGPVLTQAV